MSPTKRTSNAWEANGGDDVLQISVPGNGVIGGIDSQGAGFGALQTVITSQTYGGLFLPQTYGAVCDGSHIALDTAGIIAALNAASAVGGTVFIPAGNCQFDNSTGPLTITGFNGTITGEGKSSSIAFNTLVNTGWSFIGSSNLTIRNLSFSFMPMRTIRQGAYPVGIEQCSNVLLENNYFNNGNGAGVRIGNSNNVRAVGNTITNFLSNGFFTVNNNDLKFENTVCSNLGDGCEEYSFYDGEAQSTCQRISSIGMSSTNDNAGFVINSCQQVSVSGFSIKGAGGFAIVVLQDPSTTKTRFPDMIQISNGSIQDTGYGTNATNTVAAPAIKISITTATTTNQNIHISNVDIKHTAQHGIWLLDNNTVNLMTDNIRIDDAGNAQITGNGEAYYLQGGNIVKATSTLISNASRYSVRNISALYAEFNGLTSVNGQIGNTSTAVIRNDSTGQFIINGCNIIDTNPTASHGAIQNGAASGIQSINNVSYACVIPCALPVGFTNPTPVVNIGSAIAPTSYTVATLPVASSLPAGTIVVVTDASSLTVGNCVGGGNNVMLAVTSGSRWSCH